MGGNTGCRRSRTGNEKLAIALCVSKGDAVVAVTQIELNVRIHQKVVAVYAFTFNLMRVPRS